VKSEIFKKNLFTSLSAGFKVETERKFFIQNCYWNNDNFAERVKKGLKTFLGLILNLQKSVRFSQSSMLKFAILKGTDVLCKVTL